ncbi:MAG: Hcp family type VI secretion system effector [Acidithiobacillales bacterium]
MAAVDYFLKVDGIEGESQDSKHKNEIEMHSWSWGVQNTGSAHSGPGMGAGKAQAQDFHFVMSVSKASPKLMLACASGEHINKAVVIARKAGKEQQEYLKWTFEGVLISSYQTGGSGSADILPTDQISFNFQKCQVDYKPQNKDGSLGGAVTKWADFNQNKWG